MRKKLINLMVILVMMLCFYVLTGCDSISLSDYKAIKITELKAYADAKGVDNYAAENWMILQQAVTDGQAEVEKATDKDGVDTALSDAKIAIDAVEEDEMKKHPNSDMEIDVTLENLIRQSFLELQGDADLTINDIFVGGYYGTYNQASAVIMMIKDAGIGDAEWTETVAGITFSQSSWTSIKVWRDGNFYTLTQAYENEFYSIENLTSIFDLTLA